MCRVGWEGVYLVFLCWQLCCVRLVGILLLVYIKFPLFGFVSDVETETVMTGMLGLMVRMCSECEAEREMDGGGSDGVVGSAVISERERERESVWSSRTTVLLPPHRATKELLLYTSIYTTPHCVLSTAIFLPMQRSWRRETRSVYPPSQTFRLRGDGA